MNCHELDPSLIGKVARLKTEHSTLFENLVTVWARKARLVSQGKPDRLGIYQCREGIRRANEAARGIMSGRFGIGTKSVEWYTPEWIFEALQAIFDLDPSSPVDHPTFVPTRRKLTKEDDGLSKPWDGYVWLNPPYGEETPKWMEKMIRHNNGLALVFSRTDSKWFQNAMRNCASMFLFQGRIDFVPGWENKSKRSRSGAGTAIFAFGNRASKDLERLKRSGVPGVLVTEILSSEC